MSRVLCLPCVEQNFAFSDGFKHRKGFHFIADIVYRPRVSSACFYQVRYPELYSCMIKTVFPDLCCVKF